YMAPEQAAADPNVDHRADLYAVGAVAYELLTGRTPFVAATPQAMLAAHVTATPDPVALHRPAIPAEVAALVMRCLEKHPADRWQSAGELLARLEALTTPSGGSTPVATTPVPAVLTSAETAIRRAHPVRVAGLFLVATAVITALVFGATRAFGLPDWVWIAALVVMLAGLPVMLYTGRVERARARQRATGAFRYEPEPAHQRLFTWRRAFIGGGVALGATFLLAIGYAASRALGIGPAGTLLSSGTLDAADRFVLADFTSRGTDTSLAVSVTEALRVDLGQSRVVRLLDSRAVSAALTRMNRPEGAPLDEATAREVAVREGAKAVVVGEISSLGSGFVLTARIVTADSGVTLVPVRSEAASEGDLIRAVNELSTALREEIGESLNAIRASEPLERVTTASLPALQLYTRATRLFESGDLEEARSLLERAVALDSSFAMAWRKLAATLFNMSASRTLQIEAARAAFRHRDRLPPLERYLTDAYYYSRANRKPDSTIAAYRAALEFDPTNVAATNNLGLEFNIAGRFPEAEAILRSGVAAGMSMNLVVNLQYALLAQGKWAAAESLVTFAEERFPGHPTIITLKLDLAGARRDLDAIDSLLADSAIRADNRPLPQMRVAFAELGLNEMRGKLRAVDAGAMRFVDAMARDDPAEAAALMLVRATHLARQLDRPAEARAELARVLATERFGALAAIDKPHFAIAEVYTLLGDVAAVRNLRREWETARAPESRSPDDPHWWDGMEAEAEGRWEDAALAYGRALTTVHCVPCGRFYYANAWDRAGRSDSAAAIYGRLMDAPVTDEGPEAVTFYPLALRRLAEIADARGDRDTALAYYSRFVDLWRAADPELQPQVAAARARMAELAGPR
ncbi:MAG TPA: hypothetical protein VFU00_04380, partial [Gemmatimonadales bacterium]|nr:hypothetical protein [Gemmatimonadales bacterium]